MKEATRKALATVDEYIQEASKMNLSIGKLLEIEARLAGFTAYIYQEAAKAQAELNACYWVRKVGYSREQIKARNAGAKSAKDAENEAIENISQQIKEENQAVADYELLNAYCKGNDRVLTSITHRIKNLENEQSRRTQQVR
jgi:hypothetical protein